MRWFLAGLALLAAGVASAQQRQPGAPFTARERAAIVEILREALRSDPTILEDALAALEAQQASRDLAAASRAIPANAEALFRDPADPVKGAARGSVTVVEFTDYRCPFCKTMTPVIAELLRRDPDVRLVVKDIPILGPGSLLAARAALAAQKQGKYGALHDALMALRGEPTEAVIMQLASSAGIDTDRLRTDMSDPVIARRLEANIRLAQALGIQGTPAFVVGDTLYPGVTSIETLREAVGKARAVRR